MKLLQNVFLAIFLCISGCLNAQIPGYIGKRLFFNAEFQFVPVAYTPTATGSLFGLHTRYGLGAGYALSRTHTLAAKVQYLETGQFTYLSRTFGREPDNIFCKFSSVVLDVSYSSCRMSRGDIAPIGRHTAYHLHVMRASAQDNLYFSDTRVAASTYNITDPTGVLFGVGYSLTYNKMMNDQFMIQYGWQMNLPLYWGGEIIGENNQKTFDNYLKYKFQIYNFLQFKIGFAFLK